ncbi:MAG TPA: Gfo/Idh/MocA family oxidoreductase [Thermoleophilia bacterium]|nr:Gfo/Idh/MocA family oxidoreductase [Thermoleophilia bacterium]HQG53931.1 Gfo/Idh/MocA family oxidoreductase [Thermoleophilia bacterium]
MNDEKVRVGVVGLGYWGPNLARNFDRLANAELAYCCDLDEANLVKARELFPNVLATDDLGRLLGDDALDAVVVATPVPAHYALGKRVLEAGKHAFIEKPIALKADEAEDLLVTAEAKGLKLMVGHLLEYHPAVAKMKELIDAGELGRVFYAYANRLNLGKVRKDENALWSLGPHDISVINYLTGEEPEEVSARGECYLQDDVEDVVFGYIRYRSGMVGHLHLSWLDPHKSRKITVVGEKKMVVFDDMEADRKVTVYDKGATTTRTKFETYGEFVTLHFGDIHIPRIGNDEPLRIECQHFVDCILNDEQPRSDGRDALNVVRVLEAMERSLREGGRPVKTTEL